MADLTLAGVEYNAVSYGTRSKLYKATLATQPALTTLLYFNRAFTPAAGSRPSRALMQFNFLAADEAAENSYTNSLHMVLTVNPKSSFPDVSTLITSTTNGMFKQLLSYVELGTDYAYLDEVMNGTI